MEKTNAPNRIRELRQRAKITQEELGARMLSDITGSTVAKLEKGRLRLSLEYAEEIADVFGVSMVEVLGLGGSGVRVVPLVGEITAGNWQEAMVVSDETQIIPGDIEGKDLFALRSRGDSMDKIVGDGGFVVIDPHDCELVSGKAYAVMNEAGDATLKKFSSDPLQLEPCSTNPDHKPIRIGNEPFKVLGRVIYAGQKL